MSWQVVLAIAGSLGTCGISFLIAYKLKVRQINALKAEVEVWKGRWREALDQVERLKHLRDMKELDDETAWNHLVNRIHDWNALDPTGARENNGNG